MTDPVFIGVDFGTEVAQDVWYRFEDFRWAAPLNEWDEPVGTGRAEVQLVEFPVIKHTPKGVKLMVDGYPRLVCHGWRKKFASETVEDAKKDFLARKGAQKRILQNKIDHVNEALQVFAKKYD